jgi:SNF family Na+-dependent transporter
MPQPATREQWASRLGLVLAMAGNAIGLGNFLRFPRLAVENGGGAFMIPYFVALLLLGIPVMWVEWAMGRYGGQHHHSTTPGMFGLLWKHPVAKYLGVLGIGFPLMITLYYCYIMSWTLAYAIFAATGYYAAPTDETVAVKRLAVAPAELKALRSNLKLEDHEPITQAQWNLAAADFTTLDVDQNGELSLAETAIVSDPLGNFHTKRFLKEYRQNGEPGDNGRYFSSIWPAACFWLIAVGLNTYVLARGVSAGIEQLAKIAMPLLFVFAIVLCVRVLTLTPEPGATDSVWTGLNYVWEPNTSKLMNFGTWLAAAGQIFFTLSIGTGSIHVYASYLKRDDDIALGSIGTASINEFAEVILGATIAIPMAVVTFGLLNTQAIAAQGSFDLGFVAMPLIFERMPFGSLLATFWFGLLFFAGITSSVALSSPLVAFLQDELGTSRRTAALLCGSVVFLFGIPIVFFDKSGSYLGQYDFWAGTFGLALFTFIEVVIFAWIFGGTAMWEEMTRGNHVRIPRFFYYIIRYVAPLYLGILLVGWFWENFNSVVLLSGTASAEAQFLWLARATMVLLLVVLCAGAWWGTVRRKRVLASLSVEGGAA